MDDLFSRVRLLLGDEGLRALSDAHVVVAGYGAVGSFAAEALVRSGVGHVRLIDADVYEASNVNRQLGATVSNIGKTKVEVGRGHLRDLNPDIDVECENMLIGEETLDVVARPFASDGVRPCFVIDAIDTIDAKVALLAYCHAHQIGVISSMGAARKMRPDLIRCGDVSQTEICPLAREVRKRLRRLGIERGICCVYSVERAAESTHAVRSADSESVVRRPRLGSLVTVTGAFGLRMAAECIDRLLAPAKS